MSPSLKLVLLCLLCCCERTTSNDNQRHLRQKSTSSPKQQKEEQPTKNNNVNRGLQFFNDMVTSFNPIEIISAGDSLQEQLPDVLNDVVGNVIENESTNEFEEGETESGNGGGNTIPDISGVTGALPDLTAFTGNGEISSQEQLHATILVKILMILLSNILEKPSLETIGAPICWADGIECSPLQSCMNCCNGHSFWVSHISTACGTESCFETDTPCNRDVEATNSCFSCCNNDFYCPLDVNLCRCL